jgi:hypothetical protein
MKILHIQWHQTAYHLELMDMSYQLGRRHGNEDAASVFILIYNTVKIVLFVSTNFRGFCQIHCSMDSLAMNQHDLFRWF